MTQIFIDTGCTYGGVALGLVNSSGKRAEGVCFTLDKLQAALDARLGYMDAPDIEPCGQTLKSLGPKLAECATEGRVYIPDGIDVPIDLVRIARMNPIFDRGLLEACSPSLFFGELVRLGICTPDLGCRYIELK